jgi:hypothetical protein
MRREPMNDEIQKLQDKIKFDVDRLATLRAIGETVPHNDAQVIFFHKKSRDGSMTKFTAIRRTTDRWRVFYGREETGQFATLSNDASWPRVVEVMFQGDQILTKVEYLSINSEKSFHAEGQ